MSIRQPILFRYYYDQWKVESYQQELTELKEAVLRLKIANGRILEAENLSLQIVKCNRISKAVEYAAWILPSCGIVVCSVMYFYFLANGRFEDGVPYLLYPIASPLFVWVALYFSTWLNDFLMTMAIKQADNDCYAPPPGF